MSPVVVLPQWSFHCHRPVRLWRIPRSGFPPPPCLRPCLAPRLASAHGHAIHPPLFHLHPRSRRGPTRPIAAAYRLCGAFIGQYTRPRGPAGGDCRADARRHAAACRRERNLARAPGRVCFDGHSTAPQRRRRHRWRRWGWTRASTPQKKLGKNDSANHIKREQNIKNEGQAQT